MTGCQISFLGHHTAECVDQKMCQLEWMATFLSDLIEEIDPDHQNARAAPIAF